MSSTEEYLRSSVTREDVETAERAAKRQAFLECADHIESHWGSVSPLRRAADTFRRWAKDLEPTDKTPHT